MGRKKLQAVLAKLNAVVQIDAGELPSEFRIFVKGENETTKGTFIFDDAAAISVMAEYAKHGVEIAIDLEHLSLDADSPNFDPDARGWCKLELRDGELWAIDVRWTGDGAKRLTDRTQRYISPAFTFNKDSLQILSLYNIAICAIPATHEAPALVAASKRAGTNVGTLSIGVKKMDFLKMVCAALGLKEDTNAEDALKAIKALADDGDGDETPEEKKKKEEAADDPKDEEKMAAQLSRLGPKTKGAVLAAIAAKPALEKRLAAVEQSQQHSERHALVAANADKIPLHLEKWAMDPSTDMATLKAFVANAVSQPRPKNEPVKGAAGNTDEVKLSAEDVEMAKLSGMDPKAVLAHKKKKAEDAKLLGQ